MEVQGSLAIADKQSDVSHSFCAKSEKPS